MVKGSELDKQIYEEGEPTWGCKSGVLDVEDVKQFIKQLQNKINSVHGNDGNIYYGTFLDWIDELAGEELTK